MIYQTEGFVNKSCHCNGTLQSLDEAKNDVIVIKNSPSKLKGCTV